MLGPEPAPGAGQYAWRLRVCELVRNELEPLVTTSDNGAVAGSSMARKAVLPGAPMYCGFGCGASAHRAMRCDVSR